MTKVFVDQPHYTGSVNYLAQGVGLIKGGLLIGIGGKLVNLFVSLKKYFVIGCSYKLLAYMTD